MKEQLDAIDRCLAAKAEDKRFFVYDEGGTVNENALKELVDEAVHAGLDSLPHNARTYQFAKYLETACEQHPEAQHGDSWIEYGNVRIDFEQGSRCVQAYVNGVCIGITMLNFECVTLLPEIVSYAESQVQAVFHSEDRLAVEQQRREEQRRKEEENARIEAAYQWGNSLFWDMHNLINSREWADADDACNKTCAAVMHSKILKATAIGEGLDEYYAQRAFYSAVKSYLESLISFLDVYLEWEVEECIEKNMEKQEVHDDFLAVLSPVLAAISNSAQLSDAETYWKEFWKKCSARVRARLRKERNKNAFDVAIHSPRYRHITDRGWDYVHRAPGHGPSFYHLTLHLETGQPILFRQTSKWNIKELLDVACEIIPMLDRLAVVSTTRIHTKHPVRYSESPDRRRPEDFEDPALRAMAEILLNHYLPMVISEYGKSRVDLTYYFSSDDRTALITMRFKRPSSVEEAEALARLFVDYAENEYDIRIRYELDDDDYYHKSRLIYEFYA